MRKIIVSILLVLPLCTWAQQKEKKWEYVSAPALEVIIRYTKDPALLASIAQKADSVAIRMAALEKVEDPVIISKIATEEKNSNLRLAAIRFLKDPKLLAKIASESSDWIELVEAINNPNLNDQALFFKLATRGLPVQAVRVAAILRLQDKSMLQKLAVDHSDSISGDEKAAIAMKTSNDAELEAIVRSDASSEVQEAALDLIRDQQVLLRLAKDSILHSTYTKGRAAVIARLKNPQALSEIAQNDANEYVREASVLKISDQSVLEKVFHKDNSFIVLEAVVSKFANSQLLHNLVKSDSRWRVRKSAIRNPKFSDQSILAELAKTEENDEVRREALYKLQSQEDLLKAIRPDIPYDNYRWVVNEIVFYMSADSGRAAKDIINSQAPDTARMWAIKWVEDQSFLESLVTKDSNWEVRERAIMRLTNEDLLVEIAKTDQIQACRLEALRKIKSLPRVKEIIGHDVESELWRPLMEETCLRIKCELVNWKGESMRDFPLYFIPVGDDQGMIMHMKQGRLSNPVGKLGKYETGDHNIATIEVPLRYCLEGSRFTLGYLPKSSMNIVKIQLKDSKETPYFLMDEYFRKKVLDLGKIVVEEVKNQ